MVRTLSKTALLTLAAAGLLSQGLPSAAEEPQADEIAAVLDQLSLGDLLTMKITTGSFLELELTKSALSMTIISREMVRTSSARNMSELLEIYVPGFVYNINKYIGAVWNMRGVSNDRNTKIVYCVNGHKLNTQARNGAEGETTLGLLSDIERVEVLRGPAGLVYGSGAMAGIVNVVTRKGEGNKSSATITAGGDGSKSIEANLYGNPRDGVSFAANAGFKESDGFARGKTRIYSRMGSSSSAPAANLGVPSDGRTGSTDGNWKIAADLTVKKFNFNMRSTRQKENSGAYFIYAPWPDKIGQPSSDSAIKTWNPRPVDGVMVQPMDPFWKNKNNGRASRKQYLSDAISSEASYTFDIGGNELKTKVNCDLNTTCIKEEMLDQYRFDAQYQDGRLIEIFGEKRYLLNAIFMLKTIPSLQAAFGIEDRIDDIGKSIDGYNYYYYEPKHYVVSNIVYNTFSVFGEGFYDINEQFGVHGGIRLDVHTRATFASPKLALVYRPSENQSVKLIYQSAANNGSADNYEYKASMVDKNGDVRTSPTLVSQSTKPNKTSSLVVPAELSELHALKPERVHSIEGAYVGKLLEGLTVEPSVSWNRVNDLFVWAGGLNRCVNVGSYQFGNLDLAVNYTSKYIKAGVNHTFQRPINTDVKSQEKTFYTYQLDDSITTRPDGTKDTAYGYYSGKNANGDSVYLPYYTKNKAVTFNLVEKSITFDGKEFTNLPTNLTKLYLSITPFEWVSLNTNLRMIWGFPGRAPALESTNPLVNAAGVPDTGNYSGFYGEKEAPNFGRYFNTMVSKKLNINLSFFLPGDLEASLYILNVLGTDQHSFVDGKADPNTVNTLRPEEMLDYNNHDLYSVDQRTFGITMTKNF